jgi:hypothetical protein
MNDSRIERRARKLAELAELGLATARGLRAQMDRAAGPKDAVAIAEAFAQVCDETRAAIEQEAALRRRLEARAAKPAADAPPSTYRPRRIH